MISLGQLFSSFSHRLSFELEVVGVVHEAVEDRIGEGGIADRIVPVIERELAGDEGRVQRVTVFEDLEQVTSMLVGDGAGAEVVEDEQVGLGKRCEQFVVAAVGFGHGELSEVESLSITDLSSRRGW